MTVKRNEHDMRGLSSTSMRVDPHRYFSLCAIAHEAFVRLERIFKSVYRINHGLD